MWGNQKVMRGPALVAVALFFGVLAAGYHVGTLAKAGAGLFPLMVSGAVGLIGPVMWHAVTRLGEAQILLPLALLAGLAAMRLATTRPRAIRWLVLLLVAAGMTTISKVAFIGWGIGWRAFDFTGISGHAMFAAAVYPVLFDATQNGARHRQRRLAVVCGCALALLIGISRVMVGAHSVPEVVAGLLLGGKVSAKVLVRPNRLSLAVAPVAGIAVAMWLVLMPLHAPAPRTQATVTRLALWLSGHAKPHTRSDLLRGPAGVNCRCNTRALAPSRDTAMRWTRSPRRITAMASFSVMRDRDLPCLIANATQPCPFRHTGSPPRPGP